MSLVTNEAGMSHVARDTDTMNDKDTQPIVPSNPVPLNPPRDYTGLNISKPSAPPATAEPSAPAPAQSEEQLNYPVQATE